MPPVHTSVATRSVRLVVRLLPSEDAALRHRADQFGLTVSALTRLALGTVVPELSLARFELPETASQEQPGAGRE